MATTPSLQNVFIKWWKAASDAIITKPNLQNVFFGYGEGGTPIPEKPNLQNVSFGWRDPDYYPPLTSTGNPLFMFGGF